MLRPRYKLLGGGSMMRNYQMLPLISTQSSIKENEGDAVASISFEEEKRFPLCR